MVCLKDGVGTSGFRAEEGVAQGKITLASNYDEYLKSISPQSIPSSVAKPTQTAMDKQRKLDREARERKKQQAAAVQRLEEEIFADETRISELEELFSDPDTYSGGDVSGMQKEYNTLKEHLDALYAQYEALIQT